jgi:hypothetical protein
MRDIEILLDSKYDVVCNHSFFIQFSTFIAFSIKIFEIKPKMISRLIELKLY